MEDSSLKVELAEQEMRRAVGEMKQEQRLNSAQAAHSNHMCSHRSGTRAAQCSHSSHRS